ncbi:hypothetical protein Dimus_010513, partial [Dionaea muscipula]
ATTERAAEQAKVMPPTRQTADQDNPAEEAKWPRAGPPKLMGVEGLYREGKLTTLSTTLPSRLEEAAAEHATTAEQANGEEDDRTGGNDVGRSKK